MFEKDRERLLSTIITGRQRLILINNGVKEVFWLTQPPQLDKLISNDIYDEASNEASLNELYTEEESIELLKKQGFWTDKDEEDLKTAIKNIDNLKVGLYKSIRKRERDAARIALTKTKSFIIELSSRKYKLASNSIEWHASVAKNKYLVGKSLLRSDDTKVWSNDDFWRDSSSLLDETFRFWIQNKISEGQIRDLARNDPWRSIWTCKDIEKSVFGLPCSQLSDDQKAIIAWSRLYDSCYEDKDRPSDETINDDDMFDGWLIFKRREREAEVKKNKIEEVLGGSKASQCNEVFILGSNPGEEGSGFNKEELDEIEDLNSGESANIKKMRMNEVFTKGEVPESQMPDTKQYIRSTLAQMAASRGK